jgi:hypothetical protein
MTEEDFENLVDNLFFEHAKKIDGPWAEEEVLDFEKIYHFACDLRAVLAAANGPLQATTSKPLPVIPWSGSNLTEMEELLQKVQQLETENAEQCVLLGKGGERECALLGKVERLERENAALRRDVYQCPPTSENDYEGLTWSDAFEVLERDNAALRDDRNELRTALFAQQKQQSESNREWAQESAELKIRLGVLERENAALREKMKVSWDEISVLVNQNSALLEALKTIAKYDQNSPHGDGICPYGCDCPSIANTALIKARKEAQP